MRSCLGLAFAILLTGSVAAVAGAATEAEANKNELELLEEENDVQPEVQLTTLSRIDHFLLRGGIVDISLNKETFEEECFIVPPGGEMISTGLIQMEGVTVHSKSYFVSCRVTMGPMTDDMFGLWQLCGKSALNGATRCQPVGITRDTSNWQYSTRSRADHAVNFGGTVHTGVAGSETLINCHVITPAGEDLVITSDVKYPHIELFEASQTLCSIIFRDFTEDLLGEWAIMGRFRARKGRLNENRQPLNFFLYNPDNPYEQAYNVTVLETAERWFHMGGELTLEVSSRAGIVEECKFITPSGQSYGLTNYQENTIEGVHFVSSDTAIACQIILSPISEASTGTWQIRGNFNNGILFDEIHGTFEVIQEDPTNPIEDERDREITMLVEQTITTKMDTIHRITIAPISNYIHESCYLITPTGLHYTFIDGFHVPGVQIINENRIECGIDLTVNSFDMVGNWMLATRASNNRNTAFIERRQPFTIRVEVDDSNESEVGSDEIDDELDFDNMILLSQIDHMTARDESIDISLNRESFEEECYVLPPRGGVVKTDKLEMEGVTVQSKSSFVSCRITLGPMTDDLLGLWKLCGKSTINQDARCQPVTIDWYDTNWRIVPLAGIEHPVNFGGFVHTGVSGSGAVTSCHVVTPAGEDLVLSSAVRYPHIERLTTNQVLCSIVFRDITEDMIGDWVVYGRFFHRNTGIVENRRPMNFFLYNPENPYEQAYNVTELQDARHMVHLGGQLTLEVTQRSNVVQDCILRTPSGQLYDLSNIRDITIEGVSLSGVGAVCQVIFNPITKQATGTWHIAGKFNTGVLFNEIRQTFELFEEDPQNPIEEDVEREITMLAEQLINTEMNTTHRITIATISSSSIIHESCHLISPTGLHYTLVNASNVPGVQVVNENRIDCGINMTLQSYDMIGEWTLLARSRRNNPLTYMERRQPFIIRVEENFILQNDINIAEGADLYLHLNYASTMPETCALFGPNGAQYVAAEEDPLYPVNCGFVVRNVDQSHTGTWIIEYGVDVRWRGSVNVHVIPSTKVTIDDLRWSVGDSIDVTLGPEDAVFCKIEDPQKHVVFKHFGQCRIVLDRVTIDHSGLWHMHVGTPGAVVLQNIEFTVSFKDDSSLITTAIERNEPSVKMSCSVPAEYEVSSCTFMSPQGEILVAAHGVAENGYMFNGSFVNNYESNTDSHDCTLRLVNPTVADMGIWRCGLQTTTGTHYAFLTVLCPHLLQDPQIAASAITQPVLHSLEEVSYEEDVPVVMSCSIPTELRYCYFRARNGSVYNVFPTMSSSLNVEYVGEGLDAGDCGIRFKNGLGHGEGGTWSCHVGLTDPSVPEQRVSFNVDIRVKMSVRHYHSSDSTVVVQATVYDPYKIEYCRFVRMDGQGFTWDNVPDGYEIRHENCTMHIKNPTILDLHPWTVAVKFAGIRGETSMTTTENLLESLINDGDESDDDDHNGDDDVNDIIEDGEDNHDPPGDDYHDHPVDDDYHGDDYDHDDNNSNVLTKTWFWVLIVIVGVSSGIIIALIPKNNREWTYKRASGMSRSFRSSWDRAFSKKLAAEQERNKGEHVQNPV